MQWNGDNQKYIILYMSHFAIDWMFKCDYFPPHFLSFIYDLVRAAMHVNGFFFLYSYGLICKTTECVCLISSVFCLHFFYSFTFCPFNIDFILYRSFLKIFFSSHSFHLSSRFDESSVTRNITQKLELCIFFVDIHIFFFDHLFFHFPHFVSFLLMLNVLFFSIITIFVSFHFIIMCSWSVYL